MGPVYTSIIPFNQDVVISNDEIQIQKFSEMIVNQSITSSHNIKKEKQEDSSRSDPLNETES